MSEAAKEQLHALINGRVQGVGFRYFVKQSISATAVTGWVRNLFDGRVEVLAEGSKSDLKNLLVKLHAGPSVGYVDGLDEHWGEASDKYNDFQIIATAPGPMR